MSKKTAKERQRLRIANAQGFAAAAAAENLPWLKAKKFIAGRRQKPPVETGYQWQFVDAIPERSPPFYWHSEFDDPRAADCFSPLTAPTPAKCIGKPNFQAECLEVAKRMHYAAYRVDCEVDENERINWQEHHRLLRNSLIVSHLPFIGKLSRRYRLDASRCEELRSLMTLDSLTRITSFNPFRPGTIAAFIFWNVKNVVNAFLSPTPFTQWIGPVAFEEIAVEYRETVAAPNLSFLDQYFCPNGVVLEEWEKYAISKRFGLGNGDAHSSIQIAAMIGRTQTVVDRIIRSGLAKIRIDIHNRGIQI